MNWAKVARRTEAWGLERYGGLMLKMLAMKYIEHCAIIMKSILIISTNLSRFTTVLECIHVDIPSCKKPTKHLGHVSTLWLNILTLLGKSLFQILTNKNLILGTYKLSAANLPHVFVLFPDGLCCTGTCNNRFWSYTHAINYNRIAR